VTTTAGHLHVLRSGVLHILNKSGAPTVLREPTVLLYPRPQEHTFQTEGADIVCAFVEFGAEMLNPLAAALPNLLLVPLASAPELEPTMKLLFAEAFAHQDGRQAAVDRLAEYLLLLLLRSAIKSRQIEGGILTALSDIWPELRAEAREIGLWVSPPTNGVQLLLQGKSSKRLQTQQND
jgi:hypothetical protein